MISGRFTVNLEPLEGLKRSLVNKIMRKAVKDAANPVKDTAKSNALTFQRTGNMARSLGIKIKTYPTGVVAIVGPRSDYRKILGTRVRGKHIGSAIVYQPSKIAHLMRGARRFPARPFLDSALTTTKSVFEARLSQGIADGIARELGR